MSKTGDYIIQMEERGINVIEKDLHIEAGLIEAGLNDDGDIEYLGTQEQWNNFEKLSS